MFVTETSRVTRTTIAILTKAVLRVNKFLLTRYHTFM